MATSCLRIFAGPGPFADAMTLFVSASPMKALRNTRSVLLLFSIMFAVLTHPLYRPTAPTSQHFYATHVFYPHATSPRFYATNDYGIV